MNRYAMLMALAAGAAVAAGSAAQAQITSAQQSALRANCRSDFMSHCSGVTPGGKDALVCLQKSVDKLSGGCQAAVRATMPAPAPAPAPAAAAKPEPAPAPAPAAAAAPPPPPPAPAPAAAAAAAPAAPAPAPAAPPKLKVAAPPPAAVRPAAPSSAPTAAEQSAIRTSCRNDFMAKCAGVQPGGRDALVCLQKHVATLSAGCRSAVAATMGGSPVARPAAAAAAVAAPAAPAPAAALDPAKLKALKFTCRGDFRRLCKNVPEGPEAFACLQAHSARLSPNCRTSVADLAASIPEGAAMPAPTPAAVKPAPVPHNPKAPVVDAAAMIRGCKLDMVRHCRGVGVGDGKMIACLTAHEADLTFRCRALFKITSPLH